MEESSHSYLDQIQIVLVDTQDGANIGAVCRAMKTMGITRLAVTGDRNYDSDRIRTRKIGTRCVLVGDESSEISAAMPPTAAIVGIAAAKQADAVVEAILRRSRSQGVEDSSDELLLPLNP